MKMPRSMRGLENLGRVRLSNNFYFRDFLYSEIAGYYGIPNIPENPELAIKTGRYLCENLLEPLQATFGRLAIRSGYRSARVCAFGNARGMGASVSGNAAYHIWDLPDSKGLTGAAACVVIPWFADRYEKGEDWRNLAWWINDHLEFAHLEFYPRLCAFNLQWHEIRNNRIDSFIAPRGCLTRCGRDQRGKARDRSRYDDFPVFKHRN